MLKPKNISIKKITEPTACPQQHKKQCNSRKSLKLPKKQFLHSNQPSPIHIMKEDTENNMDNDESESNHGNFIKYINGYLNQLDSEKGDSRSNVNKSQIEVIKRKITKEKEINRNMQKNIVEFQRILLQRTQKLDILEDCMRRIEAKQNDRNYGNLAHYNSHAKSRNRVRKVSVQQVSSELEHISSQFSQVENADQKLSKFKQRRKTQIPSEIQRMISRTMAIRPQKYNRHKY